MSNDDDFDNIVGGEDSEGVPEFDSIMEVMAYFWPKFFPGHIFVKGMVILESVSPDGRGNYLESSSPITDGDILGFCEWGKAKIVADINAQGWIEAMAEVESGDEGEDELEDDQ